MDEHTAHTPSDDEDAHAQEVSNAGQDEMTDLARRKLLRLGAYSAPLIIGSMLLSRNAYAQTLSCNPPNDNCDPRLPCNPDGGPCNPPFG